MGDLKQIQDAVRNMLPERLKALPSHMDFGGQKLAEKIFQIVIILFAVVGFIWGYICEKFSQTVYILAAGCLLACLLTLPPWPFYRVSPIKWQPAQDISTDNDSSSKNKKKK